MDIYRKLWHLSSLWAPIVYFYWLDRPQAVLFSFLFLLFFLVFDIIRLNWRWGNEKIYQYFSWLLREEEKRGLNTAVYFSLSCLICSTLFEKQIAVLSVVLLCVGDPIAAIIGTKYGSIKILNKSLQGSLACFVICFFASLILFDPAVAFWAAFAATFFELFSFRLDDNLSIPIFSGMMITLIVNLPPSAGPIQYFICFIKVCFVFIIISSLVGIGMKQLNRRFKSLIA